MKKPPLKRFPDGYRGRKPTLSEEEIEWLLTNPFIVEEKLDGSLEVREQDGMFLMLEDMKYMHSVYYDRLPGRYILVDVCVGDERLPLKERREVSERTGLPLPPLRMKRESPNIKYEKMLSLLFRNLKGHLSEWGPMTSEGFVVKSEADLSLGGKYSGLDLTDKPRYKTETINRIVGQEHGQNVQRAFRGDT